MKQLLNLAETEGDPVCMEVCSHYLVVGTSMGAIKLYDLSRRWVTDEICDDTPSNLSWSNSHVQ